MSKVAVSDDWAGPDVPVDPPPPGAVLDAITAADDELGTAAAVAARAAQRQARTTAQPDEPIRTRALRLLADNLPELESIIQSGVATPAERTAALAQIARIADAYSADGPTSLSARPLCTLTYAELCQRVAEIDARRAQLLAAIAAGTPPAAAARSQRPDPAGRG